jgi:cytochrome c-type biogenesis protein CcmH/NrfF
MSARAVYALVAALLALALLAPAAGAPTPRTTLPDVEDEVMCLECGTALNISTSPVADEERAFIKQLIARGLTKDQVKAALVREYGPRILAEPQENGFSLTAWLVPIAAALGALALVVGLARHWRRRASDPGAEAADDGGPALDPADARRLDADLAAFDR